MSKSILIVALAFLPTALLAQSPKSALGGDGFLWAGAEFSDFNPDFDCRSDVVFNCPHELYGIGAFADLNLTTKIGAEGEARWLEWNGKGGETESSYLLGPRYRVYSRGRYKLWVKALVGGGWITTANYPQQGSLKGSYLAYAPGGTFTDRLTNHLQLQADYEYQFWPSFAGPPTYTSSGVEVLHNGGLSPNGVSVGIAWRFLGQ